MCDTRTHHELKLAASPDHATTLHAAVAAGRFPRSPRHRRKQTTELKTRVGTACCLNQKNPIGYEKNTKIGFDDKKIGQNYIN